MRLCGDGPTGRATYWYSTVSASENDIVPLGVGVITRARVRVGSHSGPMQFAVGRAQLDRNKEPGHQLLCCVWRAMGPVFTPRPNAITTVTLNEPVLYVRDVQSNQDEWDNLGLSVLAPGGPGRYAVLVNADWQAMLAVKLTAQFAPVRNSAASIPLI